MIKAEIKDKELLQHLDSIEKDGMSIFVMAEGRYRGAFFNGTRFINQMRANHNLGILETLDVLYHRLSKHCKFRLKYIRGK